MLKNNTIFVNKNKLKSGIGSTVMKNRESTKSMIEDDMKSEKSYVSKKSIVNNKIN